MDYARFVRLRSPLWERFETALDELRKAPGGETLSYEDVAALAFDYRQLLHDQALAAARYPGTSAARRLQRLSIAGTRLLVREQAPERGTLWGFFSRSFPAALARQRQLVGIAVALFLATACFGFALALVVPTLGGAFVGGPALEKLEEGELWTQSLTTTVPPSFSSARIATNNLSVALTGWAGGALAGLGALYVLLLNGLMLGAVLGLTLHFGLFHALLEFISAHGPLELTVMVVSAAGGLVLARGLLVADDRPRNEVLAEAGRDALTILGGCLPWLLLLAVVESFISPSEAFSAGFKLALGVALEALFVSLALGAWQPVRRLPAEEVG